MPSFMYNPSYQHSNKHGYVLSLMYNIGGQQTSGIESLMSLQCWIGSMKLTMLIPEPVVIDGQFMSFYPQNAASSASLLHFHDLFDILHHNNITNDKGYPQLVSNKNFLLNAPRKVIYIESVVDYSATVTFKIKWTSNNTNPCYSTPASMSSLASENFCIVKVLSLYDRVTWHRYHEIFTKEQMYKNIFGELSPEDITLVFNNWRTTWYVENPNGEHALECKDLRSKSNYEEFRPSTKLLEDAQRYTYRYLHSQNVAVMYRLEQLMHNWDELKLPEEELKYRIQECLNESVQIFINISGAMGQDSIPFVALDMGKYGSKAWHVPVNSHFDFNWMKNQAKMTLSLLFQNHLSYEEWEESFVQTANSSKDGPYIAALQRILASQAECLIAVGGGSFQELAMKEYMKNHPDKEKWCIYSVCHVNYDTRI